MGIRYETSFYCKEFCPIPKKPVTRFDRLLTIEIFRPEKTPGDRLGKNYTVEDAYGQSEMLCGPDALTEEIGVQSEAIIGRARIRLTSGATLG